MSRTIEELTRAYETERETKPKAVEATDVPGNYDAITPQWLTRILCRDVPGAEVVSFTQGEKDDGSSNRRRLFLTYNRAGERAGLPATVFCKGAEELKSRIMLGMAGTSLGEVNFFNKVRHRLDIEAPVALHAAFDPHNYAYIVMMRDIADRVEFCDERTHIDRDKAESLVDLLATLHGTFYEHEDLGTEALPYRRFDDFWNNMLHHSTGWETACDTAFGIAESVIPPRLFKRRAEIWPATIASVERQGALPRTLLHSDVHLKNWYVTHDGRMGLSDWQILTIGHWSRDLIYALATALEIEDRRAWQADLIRRYLDKLAGFGVPRVSLDEALLNCRQQLFTALAFWTITLVPAPGMPAMQPERTTYRFIERMTAAIDDLDALDSFG
jgi:aminoglycoside phosphotransferase (APT) family kinase protein